MFSRIISEARLWERKRAGDLYGKHRRGVEGQKERKGGKLKERDENSERKKEKERKEGRNKKKEKSKVWIKRRIICGLVVRYC